MIRFAVPWAYFATGMYEGRLQATAIDPTHAKLTKICGRPSSDMQTQCEGGLEKEAPVGWEDSQQTLELCHGRLLGAGEVLSGCEYPARLRQTSP